MNTLPTLLTASLEISLNQILKLDANTPQRLAQLQNKVVGIHWTDLKRSLFFLPTQDKILVLNGYGGEPDTLLTGTVGAFLRRQAASNKSQAFFQGEIQVSGNTHLGELFNRLLLDLNVDWEEHFSHLVGDVAAHQIGLVAKTGFKWLHRAGDKFISDTADYLQEEKRIAPTQVEVEGFNQTVDRLRSDVDRLSARIQRLL